MATSLNLAQREISELNRSLSALSTNLQNSANQIKTAFDGIISSVKATVGQFDELNASLTTLNDNLQNSGITANEVEGLFERVLHMAASLVTVFEFLKKIPRWAYFLLV